MDIPRYEPATMLGSQIVIGEDASHLNWHAYVTDDPPAVVKAFYEQALGATTTPNNDDEGIWRFPPERPRDVLHVLPITADGPHQTFRDKWAASAKTVIIVAHMERRLRG
jgi:hypothetical protein